MSVCVHVSVCLLPRNLGECFISLLVEPIAGKNMSPSDKKLCRFLKNVSVAVKSWYKVLSIDHHLEISLLLLMSAENTEIFVFLRGRCKQDVNLTTIWSSQIALFYLHSQHSKQFYPLNK